VTTRLEVVPSRSWRRNQNRLVLSWRLQSSRCYGRSQTIVAAVGGVDEQLGFVD
jgi:hypothetical protein